MKRLCQIVFLDTRLVFYNRGVMSLSELIDTHNEQFAHSRVV